MTKVRFSSTDTERKAIGLLAGRFPFKTYADGYTLVPEMALARLASEGIEFAVEGRAAYAQSFSAIRDSSVSSVQ